jgi:predicted nucleotidyltransferase
VKECPKSSFNHKKMAMADRDVFRSVLRDDFGPDSDVDVLVEFEPGQVPGLDFISIEQEFSRLLQGRRVDMVTPKFLNSRIREHVLKRAEPLYVAA